MSSIGAPTPDANCILIEDAQVTLPREDAPNGKMAKDSLHPRLASSSLGSGDGGGGSSTGQLSQPSASSANETPVKSPMDAAASPAVPSPANGAALELEADGRAKRLAIDPAQLWVAYVQIGGGQSALRMELQLPRGAPFALYGRRNAAPSITQHDFSEFVLEGGDSIARFRRETPESLANVSRPVYYNTSLVKPVEPGRWFLAVYNDDLQRHDVSIGLTLTNEVATPCPDDCNGRGQCINGKCLCRDGFAGNDCATSKSVRHLTFLNDSRSREHVLEVRTLKVRRIAVGENCGPVPVKRATLCSLSPALSLTSWIIIQTRTLS